MKFTVVALLSANLAVLASAFTTPVGSNPSGNPIYKPNLGDIVPKGQPYTITWNPTSTGTVTLVLLRGPSTNVVPLKPIVENIPNSGSYVWTPDSSLEADTSRYGIQLIQDADGAYQYSTQFGIGESSSSSGSSSAATETATDLSISKAAATDYSSSTLHTDTTSTITATGSATTTTVQHTQTVCNVCSHNTTVIASNTSTSTTSYSSASVTTSTASTSTTLYSTTAAPTTIRTTTTSASSGLLPSSSSAPANASSTSLPPPNSAAGQLAVSFGSAMVIGIAGFLVTVCLN